jgi:hypothetical protein
MGIRHLGLHAARDCDLDFRTPLGNLLLHQYRLRTDAGDIACCGDFDEPVDR